MTSAIPTALRKLLSSRRGSVAIQIGLSLVTLVGVAGLGSETTFLIYKHRQMQVAADSAALSGVIALSQAFPRDSVSEARAVAAGLGFINGVDRTTVTVNAPPAGGSYAGNAGAVEVIVSQLHDLSMMRMVTNRTVSVGTRSVALQNTTGRFCFLALDPTSTQALYMSNNAVVGGNCGVAVNSSSETAVYLNNNAVINTPVMTHGNWQLENNAALNGAPNIPHGPTVADPYVNAQIPEPPACTGQSGSGSNNITRNLTPGRFCTGWDFKNNVTLNLAPGVYYVDTKMSIKNNVVVNGQGGVTIVVNNNYAIDIDNNAFLNITAPTTGDLAGIAFFSRRDATSTLLQKFSNNTFLDIQGALYFPNQILEVDNNGTSDPTGCTHVIGRKIKLMNNATMKNDCENTGVKALSPPAQLVE